MYVNKPEFSLDVNFSKVPGFLRSNTTEKYTNWATPLVLGVDELKELKFSFQNDNCCDILVPGILQLVFFRFYGFFG
jgi:hypothetical protein